MATTVTLWVHIVYWVSITEFLCERKIKKKETHKGKVVYPILNFHDNNMAAKVFVKLSEQ